MSSQGMDSDIAYKYRLFFTLNLSTILIESPHSHMPPYGNMVSSGMHHRNDRGFNNRAGNRGPGRGGAAMDDPYSYRTGSNQMDHPQDHRPRGDRDRGYGGGGRSGGGLASDSTRYRFKFSDNPNSSSHSSK